MDYRHISNVHGYICLRDDSGFTYTSIGLALSSISRGRFFPAIGLIAILMGTRSMAAIIDALFDKSLLYIISPYDAVAHVCQALIGTEMTYEHPWFGV